MAIEMPSAEALATASSLPADVGPAWSAARARRAGGPPFGFAWGRGTSLSSIPMKGKSRRLLPNKIRRSSDTGPPRADLGSRGSDNGMPARSWRALGSAGRMAFAQGPREPRRLVRGRRPSPDARGSLSAWIDGFVAQPRGCGQEDEPPNGAERSLPSPRLDSSEPTIGSIPCFGGGPRSLSRLGAGV